MSLRSGRHLLGARWVQGSRFDLSLGPGTGKDVGEVSALYGRGSGGPRWWRSAGIGLGMVYGTEYRQVDDWIPEEREIGPTIGLALEGQLNWHPSRLVGIGLLGFGNVNSDSPFGGLLLAVQVGRLR